MRAALRLTTILALAGVGACEDRSYREIGDEIYILTKRTDGLVRPARERLARFNRRAIPQIETALHTATEAGARNLVQALETIGDEEAIPVLRHFAVYEPNGSVRVACEAVLRGWAAADGARAEAARLALVRVAENRARKDE